MLACLLSFGLGILAFAALSRWKANHPSGGGNRLEKKPGLAERLGVMNLILIIVGVALLAFTLACIWMFVHYMTIPDTLVTCVFATLGGECGIMGWIKTTKERHREHRWEQEEKGLETGAGPDDDFPAG